MPYFDKEAVRVAGSIDLLTYLEQTEPGEIVRQGVGRYTTRSHDSLTMSNGKWYWFSRGIGGRSALDFLIKGRGRSFQEAVSELLRFGHLIPEANPEKWMRERRIFTLPPKTGDGEKVITYLRGRAIHPEVIELQLASGAVYESAYKFSDSGKTRAQAVFLGFDENGDPRYAHIRGLEGSFKGDAAGSDKRYPFAIKPETASSTLHVFESAIDLLSFASLLRYGHCGYSGIHMISLGGIQMAGKEQRLPLALKRTLDTYPDIGKITLCLDNDAAGIVAAYSIKAALEKDYEVVVSPPPKGKDYNDYLCLIYGRQTQPMIHHER